MPPVEDHEVHEKVKKEAGYKYGCNKQRVFAEGYYAKDRRYRGDGTFHEVLVWIPHAMSTSCRNFYLWDTDTGCADCPATKDTEYANRMRGLE